MYYADSLMATPAGVTMYNNFIAHPQTEDTTANGSTNYAYQATMNYYMTEYLQAHPQHFDSVAICYNADFSLNIPADNYLFGYRMYDGVRNSVTDFNYVTALNILPDNKIPTDAYILSDLFSNQNYQFNLDPVNNPPLSGIPSGVVRNMANYTSFELFDGGDDPNLPTGYLHRTPPSGRRSTRINNQHIQFHINRLEKKIYITQGDSIFYFSYAVVMQNPQPKAGGVHDVSEQPFFIARLRDNYGNILSQINRIADYTDPSFRYYIPPSDGVPIVYNDWSCDRFDLRPYADTVQVFTVEFLAADCGLGGHFGYAYVSFCEDCGDLPSIKLDSTSTGCLPSNYKFCGTFHVNDSLYQLIDINIEVAKNDNTKQYVSVKPVDINSEKGTFCFELSEVIKKMTEDTTCADIFAIMRLINANGDTISIRSTSIIENTQFDSYNDFCHDSPVCCPTDTLTMDFSRQFCLLGQGSEDQHLVGEGSFLLHNLPADYDVCGFLPGDFAGASLHYFSYNFFGGIFEYEVGIIVDDWTKLTPDGYLTGSWKLCSNHDTCVVPVKLRIFMSQSMMCGLGEGQMCINYQFLGAPPIVFPDGKGYSCTTVKAYFPFDKVFYGRDTCIIDQYDVSFYLNTTLTPPTLIDHYTVSSPTYPTIKRLLKNICWPSAQNPYITGITMTFTNNCGDTCSVISPLSVSPFKEDQMEGRSTSAPKAIHC